jgi:hypothetical protein
VPQHVLRRLPKQIGRINKQMSRSSFRQKPESSYFSIGYREEHWPPAFAGVTFQCGILGSSAAMAPLGRIPAKENQLLPPDLVGW